MLKLLCGPSGSGKTEQVIRAIEQDAASGIRCFLLVPEQQAYISERDLTARLPSSAGRCFEIVNFSRLAEDVFRVYGGVAQNAVSGGARALLMWDTLRRLSPSLRQYGRSARADAALTAKMLSALEELRNNGIDSDRLEEAAAALPDGSALRAKLNDLALIDAAFRAASGESLGMGGGRAAAAARRAAGGACLFFRLAYLHRFLYQLYRAGVRGSAGAVASGRLRDRCAVYRRTALPDDAL